MFEDLTVVIPHGGAERLRNLGLAVAALRRAGVEHAIVVEMDRRPLARELVLAARYRYVFATQQTVFHKARAMNIAIPMVRTSRFLWLDSDVIVTAAFLEGALAELDARQLDCLVPWTSVRYLNEADTQAFENGTLDVAACKPERVELTRTGTRGGAVLVRTDFVKRYGGMREEIIGWGREDDAFFETASAAGRAGVTNRNDVHLLHVHHPPADRTTHLDANTSVLLKIRSFKTRGALLRHCPPPRWFTAPWLGTKRIACANGAEKIGCMLAALYGPAIALCGIGERPDAIAYPDPSRSAHDAAIDLACTLTLDDHRAVIDVPSTVALDDAKVDLDRRWPWPDGSLERIAAGERLAHLPDKVRTMNELWRVLRHGGTAELSMPATDGRGAFADPMARALWNRRSFDYYEDGHRLREEAATRYGIEARFRIVGEQSEETARGRRITLRLEAVKAPATRTLPNVTLLGVDGVDAARLARAAAICRRGLAFGAVKLLSALPSGDPYAIAIPPIASREHYSRFIVKELDRFVDTTHVLVIQHDGFVLNPDAWDDEFLVYDYIGAPWAWATDGMTVGNGGFSLRSKRLLSILRSDPEIAECHPEDQIICRTHRRRLEARGIRFAPEELARRFSIEGSRHGRKWSGEFGFHDLRITDISAWTARHGEMERAVAGRPTAGNQRMESDRYSSARVALSRR